MNIELRKIFEKELLTYLKNNLSSYNNMKVTKNQIKVKAENGSAHIELRFLSRAQGYNLGETVYVPEISAFYQEISPPYFKGSPEYIFAMNTSMEVGKKVFATNMGGTVDLPRREEDILKTCEWIYSRLKDIYLPRAMNLIEFKKEAIGDVLENPNYYFYPFLTILYIIKKNKISLDTLNIEAILGKKVVGNKNFDKELLFSFL